MVWKESSTALGDFCKPARCSKLLMTMMMVISFWSCSVEPFGFQMFPTQDLFIAAGNKLEMNCTANLTSTQHEIGADKLDVHDIDIKPKGSGLNLQQWLTYYSATRTLQLLIPSTTVNDSNTYQCFYKEERKVLRKVTVKNIPEPNPAECVSYNMNNLICYFTLKNEDNLAPFNWSMAYRGNMLIGHKRTPCSSEGNHVPIQCPVSQFEFYIFMKYNDVHLTGTNKIYNRTVVGPSVTIFINASIVKPDPVSQLTYMNLSSTQAVLKWAIPVGLTLKMLKSMNYEIQVQSQNDWDVRMVHFDSDPVMEQETYILSELVPFTRYTLKVRCKPAAAKNNSLYWSDWAPIHFTTEQDVPSEPPMLSAGSYYISKCGTEDCLVLYWKNPEPRFRNGPLIGYLFNILQTSNVEIDSLTVSNPSHTSVSSRNGYTDMVSGSLTEWVDGQRVSVQIQKPLLRQEAYEIQVSAATEVGNSRQASSITVPAFEEGWMVRAKWVSTEVDQVNQAVRVSWEADQDVCGSITEVTYFYCTIQHTADRNVSLIQCRDDLDWITYPVNDGCMNDTWKWLNATGNVEDLRYAVAFVVNGTSGGMVWQTFRFSNYAAVPERPLFSVEPGPSKQDSIRLTMLFDENYVSKGGRPQHYLISCTRTEDQQCRAGGRMRRETVDFSNPAITITDLDAGSMYSLCVIAENTAGNSSLGEPKFVTLHKVDEDNTGLFVGLILSLTVIVIAIIVGIKLGCKKYLKKLARRNEVEILDFDPYLIQQDSKNVQVVYYEKKPNSDDEKSFPQDCGTSTFSGEMDVTASKLRKDCTASTHISCSTSSSQDRLCSTPSLAMTDYMKVNDGMLTSSDESLDSVGSDGRDSSVVELNTHPESGIGGSSDAYGKTLQDQTKNPAMGNENGVSTQVANNATTRKEKNLQHIHPTCPVFEKGFLPGIKIESAETDGNEVKHDVGIKMAEVIDSSDSKQYMQEYTTTTWVLDDSTEKSRSEVCSLHILSGDNIDKPNQASVDGTGFQDSCQFQPNSLDTSVDVDYDDDEEEEEDLDQGLIGYGNPDEISFELNSA